MPKTSAESPSNPEHGELGLLLHRPEICIADASGVVLLVQLTATRVEWLAPIQAAHLAAVARHGGPRPLLAVAKLDRRFPVDIGFDQHLFEQRRALNQLRPHIRACAVVVRFGGILGFAMRSGMQLIGLVSGGEPPLHVCSSAAEAVCWIEPYAASGPAMGVDRTYLLRSLRKVEALLGNED